jgi:predicted RNase H-like HicB family nuclease
MIARDDAVIRFTVDIIVEPDDDGYHAFCPALKGLHVSGQTEKEAVKNAADGAILYLESLIKHGDPIPVGVATEHVSNDERAHEGTHSHRQDLALSVT